MICNNKQRWNKDKCRCECKELIDKGVCDKGFIWNPSNCQCECDKSCDAGEYFNNKNCRCRKKLVESMTDKGTEIVEEVRIVNTTVENKNNYCECNSCKAYIVLTMVIFTIFIISAGINIYFIYYNWYFIKNKVFCIKSNTHKETEV